MYASIYVDIEKGGKNRKDRKQITVKKSAKKKGKGELFRYFAKPRRRERKGQIEYNRRIDDATTGAY